MGSLNTPDKGERTKRQTEGHNTKRGTSKTKKPWRDECGRLLDKRELVAVSRSWDAKTWEQFLTLTVEKPRHKEEVLTGGHPDLVERLTENLWAGYSNLPWTIERSLRQTILKLDGPKPYIVDRIYWRGYTQAMIGLFLGRSRSLISYMKKNILNEIKCLLEKNLTVRTYLMRGAKSAAVQSEPKCKQIWDVFRDDLRGRHLRLR